MKFEWKTCTIDDIKAPSRNAIVGGPFGSDLVRSDYQLKGIPVIRGTNLSEGDGKFVGNDFVFVSEEKAQQLSANLAFPGDLVFTQRGTLGQVGIVPDNLAYSKYLLSQSQMKLACDPNKADATFVYYVFRSVEMLEYIRNHSISVGVPHINLRILKSIPISLPPLPEQRAIARILSSLDDKIELNRRMNATLEAMAQTLFRAWFVDFEPVKAKAAGMAPVGLDAETAALFPSALVESELGPIPQGWEVQSLDSIANFLNGLALQKYPVNEEEGLPVIKISQLKKGTTEGSDRASSSIPAPYIVEDGDMLFSWSGSLEVTLWCGGYGALNQHLFKVTSENFAQWFYYLWTLHHLPEFREIAADKATTMGHIQRKHLTNAKVLIPNPPLLAAMNDVFTPLLERQINNLRESRTLAQVRDSLLPRLISGQLRVS